MVCCRTVCSCILDSLCHFGSKSFFDDSSVSSIDGYCTLNIDSLGFKIASSFIITLALIFLIFQLVCSTLTIVYIKRNVLEGDTAVKKLLPNTGISLCCFNSFINLYHRSDLFFIHSV